MSAAPSVAFAYLAIVMYLECIMCSGTCSHPVIRCFLDMRSKLHHTINVCAKELDVSLQGPAAALQSYLNIDAILDAIKKTGARAVSGL